MILAVLFLLSYLLVALQRLRYPYELEWMEGAMVMHVARVLNGQPLYVAPSIEFIPFIYTPLYFYISALFAWLLGSGFLPLRLVSLLASLGSLYMIARLTRYETGSWRPGFLAAAFFAATYSLSGAWFDIARIDSLFLLLTLLGIWFLRTKSSIASDVVAAILFGLAFFTKQAALGFALLLAIYVFFNRKGWQRGLFAILLAVLVAAGSGWLNWLSQGWYSYYVFDLPRQHDPLLIMMFRFWTADLLKPLAPILLLAVLAILRPLLIKDYQRAGFYSLLLAASIGVAFVGRIHPGGYLNVLIPMHAGLCMLGMIGLGYLQNVLAGISPDSTSPDWTISGAVLLQSMILIQLLTLLYNPLALLPDGDDRQAAEELQRQIQTQAGSVYLPFHAYLAEMEGKQSYAHAMAISDVLSGDNELVKDVLREDLQQAIQQGKFARLILDGEWMQAEMDPFYDCVPVAYAGDDVLWPVVGMQTRPELICDRVE